MHGGAPAHLAVLNASFECSLRFSTTPRRGLQMPTVPRRARPGAQLRTSARMAPAKGDGHLVVQERQAAQAKAPMRGEDVPGDSGVAWAVIALERPAGPRASCAPPRPASEVRPAAAFAVPRTSWGRSVDRHRPWRNP